MDDLQSRLAVALAGRYTVERELGRGGMSIVYLALDLRNDRNVALKVLRPELSAMLGPERFQQEIKLAARLKHPFIVKLHDSGEADGLLYYDMPYVEGESLRQRLQHQGKLSIGDAVRIAQEVAEALDYAHRQNWIHRDIKPENILFEEGHAVVSDFGIALAVSKAGTSKPRQTGTDIVLGTVDYMSPEQEQKRQDLDGRTDIYSLGLVLYEMLTGELPGPDRGVDSLTGRRPDVPVPIVSVVRRMLARNPAERYATAGELVRTLAAVSGRPSWDNAAKRRRWAVAAGSAALMGVALVVWLGPSQPPSLDPTHIAVMYLDDMSPDRSLAAIAAGLSEDLMDRLAQVNALRVTSQNGVRPYRVAAPTPDSIARALRVGTIIAGSVSRSEGVLRVTVRLVDGATGQLLHTRQVSRPYGELFALQDTITMDIATFLRQQIGATVVLQQRRAGASNVAAWEAVRQGDLQREAGMSAWRSGDDSGAARMWFSADSLYHHARRLDRRWGVPLVGRGRIAHAFAELAEVRPAEAVRQALESPLGSRARYDDEWIRVGRVFADSAVQLGEPNAEAFTLRGSLRYLWWLRGYTTAAESLSASESDLRVAVAQAPRIAGAWARLSQLLRYTGRFAEAEEAALHALDADAFLLEARAVYRTLLFAALNLERYDDARSWCAEGRARFHNDVDFTHCELRILGWSGRGKRAIAQAWKLADSLEAGPPARHTGVNAAERRLLLAAMYGRSGLADSARILLEAARTASQGDSTASWFLFAETNVRLLLGERQSALRLITRALAVNPQLRDYVSRAPWFRPLRDDPEFIRLVARGA